MAHSKTLDDYEIMEIIAARPHPIGRPPKLTNELIENFCDLIIEGLTLERAARLSGISATTIYRWLAMGKKEDSEQIYKELVERVQEATECSEFELLQAMRIAGSDTRNWRAQAWLLERRFPEKYGKREIRNDIKNVGVVTGEEQSRLTVVS